MQLKIRSFGFKPFYNIIAQVGPRVVKLLGSIVLSKVAADRENSILVMWHKVVNTLQECALQQSQPADYDGTDIKTREY